MEVQLREIQDLLEFFSKNTYKAKDTHPTFNHVMRRCLGLFGKDYIYSVIPNVNGELSTNYPSSLVILEKERGPNDTAAVDISVEHGCDVGQDVFDLQSLEDELIGHHVQNGNGKSVSADSESSSSVTASGIANKVVAPLDSTKLKDLFGKARLARCRARFPVPVILYKSKHICRSATLSGGPEIYGRSSLDYFFSGSNNDYRGLEADEDDETITPPENQSEWQLFDKVRNQDIRLLKSFQVQTIVDLMVEKKKVKFGVNVTSSEKVDKEKRYAEFSLVSLPYPGCEFFKQYRDNDYNGKNLIFEWNQGHVDAEIYIPVDPLATNLSINWGQYRNWDLICLTQNYLKLLLEYIRNGTSGLLIHCISGWDRTPLFVSLLRLSLWADGAIHKSLNAEQILYLTLAYDWLLFGHNLEDRLSKGEEILFFCFYFLNHVTTQDFSVNGGNTDMKDEPSPMSASAMLNARNDSDMQLEGVLFDEGSQTSLNGSSWSLSSCDSTHSGRNLDAPPAYFTVGPADPSWDDPLGVSVCSNIGSLVNEFSASTMRPSCNVNANQINGKHKSIASGGSPATISSTIHKEVTEPQGITSYCPPATQLIPNANGYTKTSPVPVPRNGTQNRTDSNSSASIGSWQLISGLGSLRENVNSSSDPASAFSHVSKTSLDRMNTVVTESSCTLVDELTAATKPHAIDALVNSFVQETDSPISTARTETVHNSQKDTHSTTKSGRASSRRRAKLLAVSKHFDMAYAYAIKRPNRFNGVDGLVSTGLSGLIGNIANRVGIRATPRIVS